MLLALPSHFSLALRAAALAGANRLGLACQRGDEPRKKSRNGKLSRCALVFDSRSELNALDGKCSHAHVLQPVVKSSLPLGCPLPTRSAWHVAAQPIYIASLRAAPRHAPPPPTLHSTLVQCNTCFAFAATAQIESYLLIKAGLTYAQRPIDASEQVRSPLRSLAWTLTEVEQAADPRPQSFAVEPTGQPPDCN